MVDAPTTIDELSKYPFLATPLAELRDRVLCAPHQTVLWVGAGLSAKFGDFPTWRQFLEDALNEYAVAGSPDHSLIQALLASSKYTYAAEYLDEISRGHLRSRLATAFQRIPPTLPYQLASLCTQQIITTNYDCIIERTLPWYEVTTPAASIEALVAPAFRLVKIHGTVDDPKNCVLSLSSYVRAYNLNLRWYLWNVFANNSVIFIGTSLSESEPFFEVLNLLRASGKNHPSHLAVKAFRSSDEAKKEGKRLHNLGVSLLPYIPDATHSFLDQVLSHIDERRTDSAVIHERVRIARSFLAASRYDVAAVYIWNLCNGDVRAVADRRKIADLVSSFFSEALSPADGPELHRKCNAWGIDLGQIWDRTADFVDATHKAVSGLGHALDAVERLEGVPYTPRRAKLSEIKRKAAKHYGRPS